MNEIENITREIFGLKLTRLKKQSDVEAAIEGCELDLKNANGFERLLRIASKTDFVIENIDLLYVLVKLGTRFAATSLVANEFWWILMNREYSPRTKVSGDCNLLKHLLRNGLKANDRDSWKHLALLMDVCYGIPKAKQIVVKLIRSSFASEIGYLLDNNHDFQLANFVVELLSNCFPRKSTQEVGVVTPPVLWVEDAKNDRFFNSPLYPFRGRHGDAQVIHFLRSMLRDRMRDVMPVHNVTYRSSVAGSSGKLQRSKKSSGPCNQFYVQASHDGVYLWDAEGMFLEIDRRYIEISTTGTRNVEISVISKPSNCFRSVNGAWLRQFLRVESLLLEAADQDSYSQFSKKIGSVRKISEVQTFLLLTHTDEDQLPAYVSDHETRDRSASLLSGPDKRPEVKDQLATPEQSDTRICSDEWDFKPSSEQQIANSSNLQVVKRTPGRGNERDDSNIADTDESPLVLAQKRKKIRETTKSLEILKKDFALVSNRPSSKDHDCKTVQRSPSLLITKFESKNNSLKKSPVANPRMTAPKEKVANSIAAKDINVLDKIFGKPESSIRKKPKRQQRLKNYKPVIEVPSQDLPARKTRNQMKGCVIARKEAPDATPKVTKAEEQATVVEKKLAGSHSSLDKVKTVENSKRSAEEIVSVVKPPKKRKSGDIGGSNVKVKDDSANVEKINNPINDTDIMDSTTILANLSYATPMPVSTGNVFTDKLQEQIFSSISHFSNEMVRKMTIINNELNNTIVKELSGKYQKLFQELQKSFQDDTEEMLKFVSDIKDMMKLPEDELVHIIRSRKTKAMTDLKMLPSHK